MNLEITSMSVDAAISFFQQRHAVSCKKVDDMFAIAVWDGARIYGAILMETTSDTNCALVHLYTDGTALVGSILYGAAWRAAKALGYKTIIL